MKIRYLEFIFLLLAFSLGSVSALAADDMCPVAREFAARSVDGFNENPNKALAGLIQAYDWCPDDEKISYNLGQAYYRCRQPDKAYEIWAALYSRNPDRKLARNLGWLAYKLGRTEEASKWAAKAGKDRKALKLQLAVLYRLGKYEDALRFAELNNSILSQEDLDQAAGYLVEKQWQTYRSGEREKALKSIIGLSRHFPDSKLVAVAKDRMLLTMYDDSADIPAPLTLPDSFSTFTPASGIDDYSASEVLALQKVKPTLNSTEKAFALIVGISNYQSINGPRFADNDARQMRRLLSRLGGFKNDSAHLQVLLNRDATLGNLLNKLDWLERKARLNPDAKIVFYFSGHGSPLLGDDRRTIKDGLLIPYEANLDSLSSRSAISLAELDKRFSKISNPNMVTIVDACFSGSGKSASGMKLIKPRVNRKLLSAKKQFITASAADRPAMEYTPGRQGAFSYFFMQGMMGPADRNKDGWVDTVEGFNYAKQKLVDIDLQQNPEITTSNPLRLSKPD